MGIALELLLIQVTMTLLIDVTGVVEDMLTPIAKWITGAKVGTIGPPISCSKCMTFWTGLIWTLCTGNFTLVTFALLLFLSCTTDVTLTLFHLLKDFFGRMVDAIYDFFKL